MRLRTLWLAAGLSLGLTQTSNAVVRPRGAEAPIVTAGRAPRAHRTIAWAKPVRLSQIGLPGWTAIIDDDTDVPLQLWGPSIAAPGAQLDPAIAEASARQFLAAHVATLAPGASASDFVVVVNELGGSGDVRTVAFGQRSQGMRVIGGSIGFAFKRDHLIMVSSTALPNIAIAATPSHALDPSALAKSAVAWLAASGKTVAVRAASLQATEPLILPIVHPRIGGIDIGYRVVQQVSVASTTDEGRWDVWIDASDATPVARHESNQYATGVVSFDVPVQGPLTATSPRISMPAPFGTSIVNGVSTVATLTGSVTWAGTTAATVVPHVSGTRVAITNSAGALVASPTLSLMPNGMVTWSEAADPTTDAQLDAYIFANTAKEFMITRLNPNLAWIDQQLSVTVNENDTCNAFWDGNGLNFFLGNAMCENTGRLADVIYHESGHGLHQNSLLTGGQPDGSLGEGLADTLAVSITRESGVGRGFMHDNNFLRDLDPVGVEKKWPQDADGEVHDEGEIIGETLVDLRKALIAKLGEGPGFDQLLKIYYGIMQRAVDIPSTYAEALVADDDDGDLSNGTPNFCELTAAFGTHGLADPSSTLGLSAPVRDNFTVSFDVMGATTSCAGGATVASAAVAWRARGGTDAQVDLAAAGTTWTGVIPTQPDGTNVEYKVAITLSDGTILNYPDNPADPYYQFFVGTVTPLYCADFESGGTDWTHTGSPDEWEVGMPMGLGGDPKAAHGGTSVLGLDLSSNGQYEDMSTSSATSPMIDLKGNTAIHLQFWRWLGVEDAAFDHATVSVNGTVVWTNLKTSANPNGTGEINHVDKEWRFVDLDVSAQAAAGKLSLSFALDSDPGAHFSGWNLDDVCVVTVAPLVSPTCGNGVVDTGETCDDGNTTDGDGCSATCQLEGDLMMGGGGGCCSVGGSAGGPIALTLLTLGAVLRRRRRR